ncbi:aminopeptidase P family protein [Micromonospora sp. WMMD812]|uniref:aminopeptidase P family protein n=1 Tax=Micromonospora sp. WMMD812 TaxID=3015152 RepID=UPI00248C5DAF|nr:aminopeptidase P family protein [Micromonospora sp. WMMD812]WBB68234.1 aminopeptidase P family protein [Micromonospora sp. WMMD812]
MREGRPPKLAEVAAFTEYLSTGWGVPDRTPPVVPGAAEAAADHRARLAEALPGRTVVLAAGEAPVRSNDTTYDFRPDSDFFWLTGCAVESAAVVLRDGDATLYLPPPAQPGDPGFFRDARYGELWVGAAPGPADWARALGVPVRPLGELTEDVTRDEEVFRTLAELRMDKDAWEIGQLRDAVDRTVEGFAAVAREIPTAIAGPGERWLQGTFDRYARAYGNGPGYATIVGSGPHAPTLHWVRADGPVLPDEVLLLDMGVEVRSHYTADVTRTLPASGQFSPVQRQVHDLVERAHRAGLAAVGPGRRFTDFHHAAMEVIARGLADWGLLPVSVDEALSDTGQHHRRYLVCGIGHHLGLDVHDCGPAAEEAYQGGVLAPGMVLTVEPGLYFHAHDLTVPPELRGIGVRIEDDLLVTPDGAEVLSGALPIDADGLEKWMATTQAV